MRAAIRALSCLFAIAMAAGAARAQGVAINGTGAAADTSAILDLASTKKGFLPPRMTGVQRDAIVLPATGLVVYVTDGVPGLYWNAGTPAAPDWKPVSASGAGGGQWSVDTPYSDLYYTAGTVSIGMLPTSVRLTVMDNMNGLRVVTNAPGGHLASFGGYGDFLVDAPGVTAGRLSLLENGNFGIGVPAPAVRLDVKGGNGDVVSGEGDLRIGGATHRLKVGVATSGGSAGGVTLMQQGAPGGYNVLALGAQGSKVAYVNGNTSRFGIGNDNPSAPLGFAAAGGKKISLYPAGANDYGFGISAGRLQIFNDGTPGGDVAIGTDAAGTFTERFAVKTNGALALSGNAGNLGQLLQSNGPGAGATWVNPPAVPYNNLYQATGTTMITQASGAAAATIPGMSQDFSVAGNARVIVSFSTHIVSVTCFACPSSAVFVDLILDGTRVNRYNQDVPNGTWAQMGNTFMVSVGPGAHTVRVDASCLGTGTNFGGTSSLVSALTLQVVPQ